MLHDTVSIRDVSITYIQNCIPKSCPVGAV